MESIPEWVGNRDLVFGPALFRTSDTIEDVQKAEPATGQASAADIGEDSDAEPGFGRWVCPYDERRSICPLSGEPLEVGWSPLLNDWAFLDAVVTDAGSD